MNDHSDSAAAPFAPVGLTLHRWEIPVVSLLALLGLLFVTWFHRDFGISWDEAVELFQDRQGEVNWRFWSEGLLEKDAMFHNGHSPFILFFIYAGEVLGIATGWSPDPIDTMHFITGLFGIAGFVFAWRLARYEMPAFWALLTALLIVSWPRYIGHSLANFKDLPFAVAWLACLDFTVKAMKEPTWRRMMHAGLAVGILLAFRLGGLVFAPIALALIILASQRDPDSRMGLRLIRTTVVGIGALIFTYLAMPYLLWNPIDGFLELLAAQGQFVWTGTTLTAGTDVAATAMERWYVPVWLVATVPTISLALFGVGFIDTVFQYIEGRTRYQQSLTRWALLLGGLFPLTYVIFAATPLYDGIRHVLFTVPPLMIFGVCATRDAVMRISPRMVRAVPMAIAVAVVMNLWTGRALHPYQMMDFNWLAGGIQGAQGQFSLDYWTITSKETGDWLEANGKYNPSACIFMGRELSWTPYMPGWEVTDARDISECRPTQWLVVPNRGRAFESLAALRARRKKTWVTEYSIRRDGAVLAVIARDPRYTAAPRRTNQ